MHAHERGQDDQTRLSNLEEALRRVEIIIRGLCPRTHLRLEDCACCSKKTPEDHIGEAKDRRTKVKQEIMAIKLRLLAVVPEMLAS